MTRQTDDGLKTAQTQAEVTCKNCLAVWSKEDQAKAAKKAKARAIENEFEWR